MPKQNSRVLPPTVVRVLDEYLVALRADDSLDGEAVSRLDALLREGQVPKPEDIATALFPPKDEDRS